MDWVNGWIKDVVYMLTGIGIAFLLAILYALFQLLTDWMERKYTQQAKPPQKVVGEVKPPMGFL